MLQQHQFNRNNTIITFYKGGKGTPVVWLHGFAEDHSVWHYQYEYFEDKCLCIVPDLPGSGLSETPADGKDVDVYADFIADLLTYLQIDRCIMFGHSMGGYITLAFAEKHPEKLYGFGLLHSTAYADSSAKKDKRKKGIETIQQNGAYSFIQQTTPDLFTNEYKQQQREQINELIEKGKAFSNRSLQQYYTAMMNRPDRTHVLSNAKVPVLFIAGEKDNAVPLTDVLKQSHLPEVSYIHILKQAAHMGLWEEAEKFNSSVGDFIYEVAGM